MAQVIFQRWRNLAWAMNGASYKQMTDHPMAIYYQSLIRKGHPHAPVDHTIPAAPQSTNDLSTSLTSLIEHDLADKNGISKKKIFKLGNKKITKKDQIRMPKSRLITFFLRWRIFQLEALRDHLEYQVANADPMAMPDQ